jgi:hypothetical protein
MVVQELLTVEAGIVCVGVAFEAKACVFWKRACGVRLAAQNPLYWIDPGSADRPARQPEWKTAL